MTYQPRYINGTTMGSGSRDVDGRYSAMAKNFPGRDFTMLDLGASSGYFCLRAAHEYGATATAVDGIEALPAALEAAGDSRVTGVYEYLMPEQVKELGSFDVGVCFSVLHHQTYWREMVSTLREQCSLLFVECAVAEEGSDIPDAQRAGEVNEFVASVAERVVARTPGIGGKILRPMYLVRH